MENHATDNSSKAPTITTAEDLLKKLRAGVAETYIIKCRDLVVPVRVISIDEMNKIRREAEVLVARSSGDETDRNIAMQKETLQMASTLKVGGAPGLPARLLTLISVDEVNFLYNEYTKVLDEVNPNVETMSTDQFRQLVDAIKKNNAGVKDLSLPQLKAIFYAYQDLIQRLDTQTSPTASSSGGQ